jgi:hypothetical protein
MNRVWCRLFGSFWRGRVDCGPKTTIVSRCFPPCVPAQSAHTHTSQFSYHVVLYIDTTVVRSRYSRNSYSRNSHPSAWWTARRRARLAASTAFPRLLPQQHLVEGAPSLRTSRDAQLVVPTLLTRPRPDRDQTLFLFVPLPPSM